MSAAHKVLNIRDYQEDLDLLSPDIPELRARFQTVDFEVTRRCPWWVGKCPMVTNAIDWVVGADAAAVFLVHGRFVAVVGRRSGRRSIWATADLGVQTLRKAG